MKSVLASSKTKTDAELLLESQQGERDAFAEIVRRHESSVRAFLTHFLFDRNAADDVAQEVFLAILKQLDSLVIESSLKGFLMRVARNKAIDYLRKRKRTAVESGVSLDHVMTSFQLEQLEVDQVEIRKADLLRDLDRCLDRLRDDHRNLVTKFYFERVTAESIAQHQGRSAGSIRMALARIRKALAHCMRAARAAEPEEETRER